MRSDGTTPPPVADERSKALAQSRSVGLAGKRIILTGASGGMGAPLIRVLTGAGATVTAMDISPAVADIAAAEAPGPGRVTVVPLDITDQKAVDRTFDSAINAMDGLDALINTAGVLNSEPAEIASEKSLDFIFDVNVKGTVFSNQAVFDVFRRQGSGSIINFGSVSGLRPEPNSVFYSASKGAVHSWTRSLAHAWGKHGIRVNALLPIIRTPMYTAAKEAMTDTVRVEFERVTEGGIALGGEYGDAERDLGPVVVFFAGDGSHFITGQLVPVDGGLVAVR